MCGIAGFYHPALAAEAFPDTLRGMLAAIAHRGPDASGYVVDDHCGLGSTRLSIIDIAAGIQPLSDASERYWLCYNGEIYNYLELRAELEAQGRTFTTHSDTEVLLQAWLHWGPDCLSAPQRRLRLRPLRPGGRRTRPGPGPLRQATPLLRTPRPGFALRFGDEGFPGLSRF